MSRSIKPFTHGTVTQKHLELVPPKRTQEWNPCTFIPSQSTCTQVSFFLPSLLLLLLSLSMSIYLAGLPSLHLLCYSTDWQFMAPAVSLSVHSPDWYHWHRVGNSWPLCTLPEQNLNCSLHTELPAPKVFLNNLLIKPFFIMPLEVPSA